MCMRNKDDMPSHSMYQYILIITQFKENQNSAYLYNIINIIIPL